MSNKGGCLLATYKPISRRGVAASKDTNMHLHSGCLNEDRSFPGTHQFFRASKIIYTS